MFRYILILISAICSLTSLKAQPDLQARIDKITSSGFYKYAHIGISVRDVVSGALIAGEQKDKLLIPASSLKIITTFSALELLGPEFQFETVISHDGYIDAGGTLHGNIYIAGGGDPTLGSSRIAGNASTTELIDKIADQIRAFGISCIEGNIIADESIYNSFPLCPSWQWNDLGNYYAAGAWGLNINENQYAIYFHRDGDVGSLTRIAYFDPMLPGLELENEVTVDSADSGDNAYIFGGPYQQGKRIVGTIPKGKGLFRIKGSMPDPPSYLAYRVHTKLAQREMGGHLFKTQFRADVNKNIRTVIGKIYSPKLREIVKYANLHSINVYCESMLKYLGWKIGNEGSGRVGIDVIKQHLLSKNIDVLPLFMEDGSGLSARNQTTPDLMTTFLASFAKNKKPEDFENLLPTVGVSGTVKNVLVQSKAKGNMWVKSGSMDKILTYAGYCRTASGRFVSFSIFLNGSTATKKRENKAELEKILEAIYIFS